MSFSHFFFRLSSLRICISLSLAAAPYFLWILSKNSGLVTSLTVAASSLSSAGRTDRRGLTGLTGLTGLAGLGFSLGRTGEAARSLGAGGEEEERERPGLTTVEVSRGCLAPTASSTLFTPEDIRSRLALTGPGPRRLAGLYLTTPYLSSIIRYFSLSCRSAVWWKAVRLRFLPLFETAPYSEGFLQILLAMSFSLKKWSCLAGALEVRRALTFSGEAASTLRLVSLDVVTTCPAGARRLLRLAAVKPPKDERVANVEEEELGREDWAGGHSTDRGRFSLLPSSPPRSPVRSTVSTLGSK